MGAYCGPNNGACNKKKKKKKYRNMQTWFYWAEVAEKSRSFFSFDCSLKCGLAGSKKKMCISKIEKGFHSV